jgi:hypothetical protein
MAETDRMDSARQFLRSQSAAHRATPLRSLCVQMENMRRLGLDSAEAIEVITEPGGWNSRCDDPFPACVVNTAAELTVPQFPIQL